MTCEDCTSSAAGPHHGFRVGCKGCDARAASRSHEFERSRKSGKLDHDYRVMLEILGLTHEEVKAAARRDALRQVSQPPTEATP